MASFANADKTELKKAKLKEKKKKKRGKIKARQNRFTTRQMLKQ